MEQLSFLETLFPKPISKSWTELEEEERQNFDEKIKDFSFDEKIIARTNPWLINHTEDLCDENEKQIDCLEEIKQTAKTHRQIYKNADREIWSYDVWKEKWNAKKREYEGYVARQLVFKIGNEVIALTFGIENIYKDDISFPAMCMAYMDGKGNSLSFTIRENFIEQGLGLLQHGEYRLGKQKKDSILSFCSMKTTLGKIIRHLNLNQ